MGSWIIILTSFTTGIYLIFEGKSYKVLNLASAFATALMMCFGGLLFTGVAKYLIDELGAELTNEIILGALVPIGAALCMTLRHFWNRSAR